MNTKPHPNFLKAGAIAARVLTEVAPKVKSGVKVITICNLAERKIVEYGGKPAFPCNVSINEEAAHYSSPHDDLRVFPDQGLVKVDIGAHVNGHLSDTAMTVDLDGSYEQFVAAAEEALNAAIEVIRPGIRLGEVGSVIENTIKQYGLKPVHQLSGHQMKQWTLHAGKNVPNVRTHVSAKMNVGETYAVEPFSTDGNGTIRGSREAFIFANNMRNTKRLEIPILQVRDAARERFGSLPWAGRWINDEKVDVTAALKALERAGAIHSYPVLIEGKNGMVAQAEHSLFVGKDGAIVSTSRDKM